MRYALVLAAALLTGCAGQDAFNRGTFHVLNAIDAGQTLGRGECVNEVNPLLGSDPQDATVVAFALLQSLAFEWINHHAAEKGESLIWQRVAIGVKVLTIGWNSAQLAKGCD